MALFSRFRRSHDESPAPTASVVLPRINQRVTLFRGSDEPSPTRVEDETETGVVVAAPDIALAPGDNVTLSWEGDTGWYMLETHVTDRDDTSTLPTLELARNGQVTRFQNRRNTLRLPVTLPVEVTVVTAGAVTAGRVLTTETTELSTNALRFTTSAPFVPGDAMEIRLALQVGDDINGRVKVIRMDTIDGSWRSACTAVFHNMLQSDRSRLAAWIEAHAQEQLPQVQAVDQHGNELRTGSIATQPFGAPPPRQ